LIARRGQHRNRGNHHDQQAQRSDDRNPHRRLQCAQYKQKGQPVRTALFCLAQ
jgi:hypothetical protein